MLNEQLSYYKNCLVISDSSGYGLDLDILKNYNTQFVQENELDTMYIMNNAGYGGIASDSSFSFFGVLLNEKNNAKFVLPNSFKDKIEAEESKINENINEDEKKLLDTFMSSKTNKKEIFENYKKQTLEKINDTILTSENEDKESWQKIYESVKSKNYSDKMTENIVNCAEMLEICNTIEE